MVKVPQVLNVVRARSAAGLSPLSFELETLGLVIAASYGFLMGLPFSAFGETVVGGMLACSAGLAGAARGAGLARACSSLALAATAAQPHASPRCAVW